MKTFRTILSTALCLAVLFPVAGLAHNKVVVITMDSDNNLKPITPLAPLAPSNDDYTIDTDTVMDNVTGLKWQRTYASGNAQHTWHDAWNQCANLTLNAKDDWRLPSVLELMSIVNYDKASTPYINELAFPSTEISRHWASPNAANSIDSAWHVSFGTGKINSNGKTNSYYVRCVRSTPSIGPILQDKNDGTVLDMATGLNWQQVDDDDLKDWEEAKNYCSNLILGSKRNWRLPNIKELFSIVENRVSQPSIDTVVFSSIRNDFSHYWSSTTDAAGNGSFAWQIGFASGDIDATAKTVENYVFCVNE